ncbi:TIGR02206 family membrane protein [Paenibacillus sp. GCM10023252]|uniref:YwaF family protein n=1 Tax=Paenibacillus sp. GCM10023252 TaxID=3252649 RepID=UPI00361A4222
MPLFTWSHLGALIILMLAVYVLIISRVGLRAPEVNGRLRVGIAALLLSSEIGIQLWYGRSGQWGWHTLPLQLCSMTVLLSAAALYIRSNSLRDVTFFLGILGALQALITPNLDYSFPHFRYLQFFLAHIAIVAANIYLLAVERYRPTLSSALRAFLWLHVLAIPAAIVNYAAGTNYMFLARKPDTASLLDLLAPWPWYLLQLELVIMLLIISLWAAIKLVLYIKRGSMQHESDE